MSDVLLCPLDFRKALRSGAGGGDCVEVARVSGLVFVRDDKTAFGAAADVLLIFTGEQFDAFQVSVRAGDTSGPYLEVTEREAGIFVFRSLVAGAGDAELTFTSSEVEAFFDGVRKNEFDASEFDGSQHGVHAVDCAHRTVEVAA